MQAIKETRFDLPGQEKFYKGKVRDVYYCGENLIMVTSDRISAFDVVLPRAIPFKGQVLNQIAQRSLKATEDIVPNWIQGVPDPNVAIGLKCEPYPIEMVVRGYLAGHAWRTYRDGKRVLCGVALPEGLSENDKLPTPIITPTTKASEGHDEDISREEILMQGIISEEDYKQLEEYTLALYNRGTEIAAKQGLILVDTKYEFGNHNNRIVLMDEIHTPDSSRYFYADTYKELQDKGEPQRQLSKEFVRQWLIENNFQGKDGQQIPEMTDDKLKEISGRYIELYENIMGEKFEPRSTDNIEDDIYKNIIDYLNTPVS